MELGRSSIRGPLWFNYQPGAVRGGIGIISSGEYGLGSGDFNPYAGARSDTGGIPAPGGVMAFQRCKILNLIKKP